MKAFAVSSYSDSQLSTIPISFEGLLIEVIVFKSWYQDAQSNIGFDLLAKSESRTGSAMPGNNVADWSRANVQSNIVQMLKVKLKALPVVIIMFLPTHIVLPKCFQPTTAFLFNRHIVPEICSVAEGVGIDTLTHEIVLKMIIRNQSVHWRWPLGRCRLPVFVTSPAVHRVVGSHAARGESANADRPVLSGGTVGTRVAMERLKCANLWENGFAINVDELQDRTDNGSIRFEHTSVHGIKTPTYADGLILPAGKRFKFLGTKPAQYRKAASAIQPVVHADGARRVITTHDRPKMSIHCGSLAETAASPASHRMILPYATSKTGSYTH